MVYVRVSITEHEVGCKKYQNLYKLSLERGKIKSSFTVFFFTMKVGIKYHQVPMPPIVCTFILLHIRWTIKFLSIYPCVLLERYWHRKLLQKRNKNLCAFLTKFIFTFTFNFNAFQTIVCVSCIFLYIFCVKRC